MNSQDLENNEIIKCLVEKHFALKKNSLDSFKSGLEKREIDEVYAEILGDSQDLRARFKIEPDFLETFDDGWILFNKYFKEFIRETKINYSCFRSGKIEISGNSYKIEKAIRNFYSDIERAKDFLDYRGHQFEDLSVQETKSYANDVIKSLMNEVGCYKLPLKDTLEVVFSLNFADWFLCSTGQSWSSCLSLDSDYACCYWAGLPGLIGDKNRGMFYLTDGTKKNYRGITVDSFFSRSWSMISTNDKIHIIKAYPKAYIRTSVISKLINYSKITDVDYDYTSKYPVDLLFHENGYSSSIYLDNLMLLTSRHLHYKSSGGFFTFYEDELEPLRESSFIYTGGLTGLIESESKITDVETIKCQDCGANISESEEHSFYDGEIIVCRRCANNNTRNCINCGHEGLENHENWYYLGSREEHVCEYCKNEHYSYCSRCEELSLNNNFVEVEMGDDAEQPICRTCAENDEDLFCCKNCNRYFDLENIGYIDEYYGLSFCKVCYIEIKEKDQLKLDFSTTEFVNINQTVIVTKENVEYIV